MSSFQPPSSSGSTSWLMAEDVTRWLATAISAPLRMTTKSDMQPYQVDEPKQAPSWADTQGEVRMRWYSVGSWPRIARPAEPMRSGMRAPADSPRNTSGSPLALAMSFTCLIFLPLIWLLDAPSTVKSLDTTPTSRPSTRPKPATLPSAGVRSRSSARNEVAYRPDSTKLPSSSSRSSRERASSTPWAARFASLSGPPMPSAFARRAASSSSIFSCAMLTAPRPTPAAACASCRPAPGFPAAPSRPSRCPGRARSTVRCSRPSVAAGSGRYGCRTPRTAGSTR